MRARDPGILPFKTGAGFGDNVDRVGLSETLNRKTAL
jgi:hypothetical protein